MKQIKKPFILKGENDKEVVVQIGIVLYKLIPFEQIETKQLVEDIRNSNDKYDVKLLKEVE